MFHVERYCRPFKAVFHVEHSTRSIKLPHSFGGSFFNQSKESLRASNVALSLESISLAANSIQELL